MNFFGMLLYFLSPFITGRGVRYFACLYYATLINPKIFFSANGLHVFSLVSHKIWIS